MRETKQIKQKKCAENFFNSEVGARQDNVIVKSTEMLVVWIWPGQFQCFYGLHILGIGLSFSANTWFALLFSHFPGAVRVAGEGHSPFLFFLWYFCVFFCDIFLNFCCSATFLVQSGLQEEAILPLGPAGFLNLHPHVCQCLRQPSTKLPPKKAQIRPWNPPFLWRN